MYSDAQKAFILKQGADGVPVADDLPQGRDQPGDLLQLEEEVRRSAADRDAAAEAARGRERQAEADRRRPEPGQGDAAGRHPPKALRPARKRKLVDEVRGEWDVSIRRACRVFEVDTSTYHYKSRRPGQAGLEQRIKEICRDARALRLSARSRPAAARGLACMDRTRRGASTASWACNCATRHRSGGSRRSCGRIAAPATRSNETWAMDFVHDQLATGRKLRVLTDRRYLLALLAGARAAVQLPRRGRGGDARKGLHGSGLPGDDPGRPGHRVRLPRSRPLGLSARRDAGLLPARQADRQCLHRSVQRPLPEPNA